MRTFFYLWLSVHLIGLTFAGTPVNDAFASRIRLNGVAFVIDADNTEATLEDGEPRHTAFGDNSLWWSWRAPADGFLTVSAVGSLSHGFDVWTGVDLANLTEVDTVTPQCPLRNFGDPVQFRVMANQDYPIAFSSVFAAGPFQLSLVFSTIEVTSPAGGSIYVKARDIPVQVSLKDPWERVSKVLIELNGIILDLPPASVDHEAGQYTFMLPISLAGPYSIRAHLQRIDGILNSSPIVSFSVLEPNDNFANAITLTGSSLSCSGDIAFATPELGEIGNTNSNGATIWYRWVAPFTGIATLTTSSGDILASVQRRTASGSNEILASNPLSASDYQIVSRQTLQFLAQASSEYFLQFSGISQPNFEEPSPGICEEPPPPASLPFNFALKVASVALGQPEIFLTGQDSTHPDSVLFVFAAAQNSAFQIRSSANLSDWQVVFQGTATGGSEEIYIPVDLNANQQFYRIELANP